MPLVHVSRVLHLLLISPIFIIITLPSHTGPVHRLLVKEVRSFSSGLWYIHKVRKICNLKVDIEKKLIFKEAFFGITLSFIQLFNLTFVILHPDLEAVSLIFFRNLRNFAVSFKGVKHFSISFSATVKTGLIEKKPQHVSRAILWNYFVWPYEIREWLSYTFNLFTTAKVIKKTYTPIAVLLDLIWLDDTKLFLKNRRDIIFSVLQIQITGHLDFQRF